MASNPADDQRDGSASHRREMQLQDFSLRLLRAQETERAYLAYELHDEIGQNLTILKLNLQAMVKAAGGSETQPADPAAARLLPTLLATYELSSKLLDQVRNLSLNLRPTMLDNLGLPPTLRWYLGRAAESGELDIQFHAPPDFCRLPTEIETAFFRIAQEAVTNVLRHAQARHLWVQLAQRGEMIELHVTDDGVGFHYPPAEPDTAVQKTAVQETLGLSGMAWRAAIIGAQLEIETAPGQGTRVSLTIPEAACAS